MNCEQIQPLLADYAAGTLPSFRVAWTAQHLAGCPRCQESLKVFTRPRAEARPERGQSPFNGADTSTSVAVQRQVPRSAVVAATLLVAALLGLAFLGVQKMGPAAQSLAGQGSSSRSAQIFHNGGVTLQLHSLIRRGDVGRAVLRLHGAHLERPEDWQAMVTVWDAEHELLLSSLIQSAESNNDQLELHVDFSLPRSVKRVRFIVPTIEQHLEERWSFVIPDLPDGLVAPADSLSGQPGDAVLLAYGMTGGVLQVRLRVHAPAHPHSGLYLAMHDINDQPLILDRLFQYPGLGTREMVLHFAMPHEVTAPLTLTARRSIRKQVGPWHIETSVVR